VLEILFYIIWGLATKTKKALYFFHIYEVPQHLKYNC